jgi:hypothetical protein
LPSPNDRWFLALDDLDEDRPDQVLGEDLQQVALSSPSTSTLRRACSALSSVTFGTRSNTVAVVVVVDVEHLDRRALERPSATRGCRR